MLLTRRTVASFALSATLITAGLLIWHLGGERIEVSRANPVLESVVDGQSFAGETSNSTRSMVEVSGTVGEGATSDGSRVAETGVSDAILREEWTAQLEKLYGVGPEERARILSDIQSYRSADLVELLFTLPSGTEVVGFAIETLSTETDPLVQAVLLEYLSYCVHDERVFETLDMAVTALIADDSRPVASHLATLGLLAALGHDGQPPHALFLLVDSHDVRPELSRDLWLGLSLNRFPYEGVSDLVREGLSGEAPGTRFGATESLRLFARNGAVDATTFVNLLTPVVLAEKDSRNRLLFLESLGAVGGEAALPTLEKLVLDPEVDEELAKLSLITMALHGNNDRTMQLVQEMLEGGDDRSRTAAVSALGALPGDESAEILAAIFHDPSTTARVRLLALQSLSGKNTAAHLDTFLQASKSEDDEVRRVASRELLLLDDESLQPQQREVVRAELERCMLYEADPELRINAMFGLATRDSEQSVSILTRRMEAESDSTVRGSAAAALCVVGWARGDAGLEGQAREAVAGLPFLVRQQVEDQLAFTRSQTPDHYRSALQGQINLYEFVQGCAPTGGGTKDVLGQQIRFLKQMNNMLGPTGP